MITSIDDLLRRAAAHAPDNTAVAHGETIWTCRQLDVEVERLADALRRAGVSRGQRVGIYAARSCAQVAAILAVSRTQAAFVVMDAALKAPQVQFRVEDAGIRTLVVDPARHETLCDRPWYQCLSRVVTSIEAGGRLCVNVLAADAPSAAPLAVPGPTIRKDVAGLLYTSGSTGRPKAVVVSHGNLLAGAESVVEYLGIREQDRILGLLPLCFDYGLNQLLCAISTAALLVLADYTFPADVIGVIRRQRATVVAGVPCIWSGLCGEASRLPADCGIDSVRVVTNSGGHLAETLIDGIRRLFPAARVFAMYGLTEAFRSTYLPPEQLARRPGSIGKAIPGAEILLLREDAALAAPGQVGEIVHRGDTVALGYWNRPEDTARVFRPAPPLPHVPPGETVVYSGDYAEMDAEGFLYFRGRRDNQLKLRGMRVSPEEIEAVLLRQPGVLEAACIGVHDNSETEPRLVAYVAGRQLDDRHLDDRQLLRACATDLPPHMVPSRIEMLPALPRTVNSKIDKTALQALTRPCNPPQP